MTPTPLDVGEPQAVRVTRWRCPHCRRSHSSRSAARLHMGRCWYNRAVRSCKTCRWFVPELTDSDGDPTGDAPPRCRMRVDIADGQVRTGCPSWAAWTTPSGEEER